METVLIFIVGLAVGFIAALVMQRVSGSAARDSFRALSAEALRANNEMFLSLAKTELAREQEASKHDLEKRTLRLNEALKPLDEKLNQMNTHNQELEKARIAAYEGLKQHLGSLVDVQNQLKNETAQLKLALRRPEGRGRWGERQLRRVMEMAGMLDHCDFVEQVSENSETGRFRPDVIVKIAGGGQIVVDSKVPLDALLDNADTDEALQQQHQRHARNLCDHVKLLSGKEYWRQFEPSPDFVIMFVPGEHFLTIGLQQDPDLFDFAIQNKVILAAPINLIALLRTVAHGWRQEKLADAARHIGELGRDLFEGLSMLAQPLQSLGDSLRKSVDHYNKTATLFEKKALTPARKLKDEYGISSAREIEALDAIDSAPLPVPSAQIEHENVLPGPGKKSVA